MTEKRETDAAALMEQSKIAIEYLFKAIGKEFLISAR
jgi:hypothetical protein